MRYLVLACCMLPVLLLQAQDTYFNQRMFNDLTVTSSRSQSKGDTIIKFQVAVDPGKVNPDQARRYYWFASGEIKSTRGNYSGKLLHGNFEKTDRKGNLLEKGSFDTGLKTGTWIAWYRNGNVARRYDWDKGVVVNTFEELREDGSLIRKGRYKNGKLHGTMDWYSPGGEVVTSEKYRNGEIVKKKEKRSKAKPGDRTTPPTGASPAEGTKPQKQKKGIFHRKSKKDSVDVAVPTVPMNQPAESNPKSRKRSKNQEVSQPVQMNPASTQPEVKQEKEKKQREKKKKKPEGDSQTNP